MPFRPLLRAWLLLLAVLSGCGVTAATARQPAAGLTFHRMWTRSTSPFADSTLAFVPRARLRNGTRRDLVFALAGNNGANCAPDDPVRRAILYAFDAASGAVVWTRSTAGPSRCTTAAPVADPSGKWVYAPGLDGAVHRYAAGTGAESRSGGWPHRVTLMPDVEKVAANPTVGSGHLYVATSGFIGDAGHYQGHLVSIDLRTGRTHVFNSLCSNLHTLLGAQQGSKNYCPAEKSGLFGRGQGTVDPVTHAVYIVSGNGPWNGRTNWGDTVLKLDPSGARLLDAYTPTNQAQLESADADLGSTAPAVLPAVHVGSRTWHLAVQGGKGPACAGCQGVALRLLNRDNLSGRGGPGHLGGELQDVQAPGGCEVLTRPAVWRSSSRGIWVVYANDCGTAGYHLTWPHNRFNLAAAWSSGRGGTTPVIAGNTLYVARGHAIDAIDPATGRVLGETAIGGLHWQYPLVAGKRLFMADSTGHVTAFGVSRT